MKQIMALVLSLGILLSLTACNASSKPLSSPSQSASVVTSEPKTAGIGSNSSVDVPSNISQKVIYDKNEIKVTVTGLDQSGLLGPCVTMLVENNSLSNITLQTSNCAVNGYMVDSTMSIEVAAGKKANDGLTLMESALVACGIGKFTNIQFDLIILDTSSFKRIDQTELISLDTSNTGKYTQEYDNSGETIYEDGGIKIVSKGITIDEFLGQKLNLYIENNTDQTVVIQCDGASVNDFMISTIFSTNVLPGAKAVDGITFMSTSLEENSITEIKSLEFSIIIIDENSFNRIAESESIQLTF